MHYEGPIYRPPSEADSLLIQATVGCPHNKCTFCMVYKKGPLYRARPVKEICKDIDEASLNQGANVTALFFPAGNSIAMPTSDLAAICRYSREKFPRLTRITVYGSSPYIAQKGLADMVTLRKAGLTRIHVGLESGDDDILARVKKGTTAAEQINAGQIVKAAGLELSEYVILGLGGIQRSEPHALKTAGVLSEIKPDFVRLRTLVPKINTLLLHEIQKGRFQLLSPHQVLAETRLLIENIRCHTRLTSDHYTNYLNLYGDLPGDKNRLCREIDRALGWDPGRFRAPFVGTQ
ncbi:MAG: radical SAM protein [Deltaproteobacteria bacterium]|nr:MAG: radical SAM protein [Deltaproteobacteria bacterium]